MGDYIKYGEDTYKDGWKIDKQQTNCYNIINNILMVHLKVILWEHYYESIIRIYFNIHVSLCTCVKQYLCFEWK